MLSHTQNKVTAVLVHRAWANGSSWNKVTTEFAAAGLQSCRSATPVDILD